MPRQAFIDKGDEFVGPFTSEREARYYYGYAHNTHQNHPEAVSEYDDDELRTRAEDPGGAQAVPVRPDPRVLGKARALIRMEDETGAGEGRPQMADLTASNGHTVAVDYDAEKHGWIAICRDPGCGLAHAGPVRPNRASAETDAERVHTAKYPPTDPAAIAKWNAGNPYNDVPAQPAMSKREWSDIPHPYRAVAGGHSMQCDVCGGHPHVTAHAAYEANRTMAQQRTHDEALTDGLAQPQRLDEYIGQPVSGYPSSPAHDARAISQYVERMYGGQPKHVNTGKGNAYRVTLPDGREMYARVWGADVTLRNEWWPQTEFDRAHKGQPEWSTYPNTHDGRIARARLLVARGKLQGMSAVDWMRSGLQDLEQWIANPEQVRDEHDWDLTIREAEAWVHSPRDNTRARRRSQPMTLDEMTVGIAPVAELALAAPEFEPFDAPTAELPSVPGAASRFDLLAAALGGGGVVVDRAKAMAGPCFDVDLGNGKTATLAEGVMGWLDEPQQEEFCVRREVLNIDEAARDHLRTYIEVAESCSTEDTTTGVASCVSRELAARSVR